MSSTSGVSFDEVIITSPTMLDDMDDPHYVYTDVALVTLRVQLYDHIPATDVPTYAVVVLENLSDIDVDTDITALQVFWQQAWGGSDAIPDTYPLSAGLSNSGQARVTTSEPVINTYNWAVNALGIRAASRFQLPLLDTSLGGDATGMGWRSEVTSNYDLVDGEIYMDASLKSMLGLTVGRWFQFAQPDRVQLNPGSISWDATRAKNIVYTDGNAATVTLSTTFSEVPEGSMVRVFNLASTINPILVKVGTTTLVTLAGGTTAEFLFWKDTSGSPTGRWIVTQRNLASGILP